jgi:hypothetical protein
MDVLSSHMDMPFVLLAWGYCSPTLLALCTTQSSTSEYPTSNQLLSLDLWTMDRRYAGIEISTMASAYLKSYYYEVIRPKCDLGILTQ